jgi:hypothetical protein
MSEKLFTYGVAVIVIGILLSVFQQAIGINAVLYYAPRIFENAGPTCVSEGVCHEGAMSCGRLQAILAAKAKAEQKQ